MTVVDSCGWLDYLRDEPLADAFEPYLGATAVLVPAVVLYEAYKVMRRERTDDEADRVAAWLKAHVVIPLDDRLALEAADYSLRYRLSLADAVVYATAQAHHATLVTSDEHLRGLPGVEYVDEAAPRV